MKCEHCGAEFFVPVNSPMILCSACLVRGALNQEVPQADSGEKTLTDDDEIFSEPGKDEGDYTDLVRLQALFPDFELLEKLGSGGMGSVYKARQKNLDRLVAIKVLNPQLEGDPEFEERFEREAKAMAKLNHPNIVSIYEYGIREGFHFFLMEFVEGCDLGQLIRSGEVTEQLAFTVIAQVCDALYFAHEQGVVHRDVKPGNIFVDRTGIAKIGDFGLAQIAENCDDFSITRTGVGMGTASYMAPEQIADSKSIDARVDIYALGVVIYEMLTGKVPAGNFPPPTSRLPRRNKRLDKAVLRAMEPDRNDRSKDIREISEALGKSFKGTSENSGERSSKKRWLLSLVGLLAVGGGVVFFLSQLHFETPDQKPYFPSIDELLPKVTAGVTPEFDAIRKRGGILRRWSEMPGYVDISAAEGIDDLVSVQNTPYVGMSWIGSRADGQTVSSIPSLSKRRDLKDVTHSFSIEWPDSLVPVDSSERSYIPLLSATTRAVDVVQTYDVAVILTPQKSIKLAAKDSWLKTHQYMIERISALKNVKSISSWANVTAILTEAGDVLSWQEPHGLIEMPKDHRKIIQIATGGNHVFGLYEDGSVVSWCHPKLLNHSRLERVLNPPIDLESAIRIMAYDFTNLIQRADGSWFAWGDGDQELIAKINSIGPALDFELFTDNLRSGAKMIWIEPAGTVD